MPSRSCRRSRELLGDVLVHAAEVVRSSSSRRRSRSLCIISRRPMSRSPLRSLKPCCMHPAQRGVEVAVVEEVVGHLVEQGVGVEVEAGLGAVPARVPEPAVDPAGDDAKGTSPRYPAPATRSGASHDSRSHPGLRRQCGHVAAAASSTIAAIVVGVVACSSAPPRRSAARTRQPISDAERVVLRGGRQVRQEDRGRSPARTSFTRQIELVRADGRARAEGHQADDASCSSTRCSGARPATRRSRRTRRSSRRSRT